MFTIRTNTGSTKRFGVQAAARCTSDGDEFAISMIGRGTTADGGLEGALNFSTFGSPRYTPLISIESSNTVLIDNSYSGSRSLKAAQ